MTGKGFYDLLPRVNDLRKEYFEVFLPELMGSDFEDFKKQEELAN